MNLIEQLIRRVPTLGGIQNTFGQGNPMAQQNQAPGIPPPAGFGGAPQIVTPPVTGQQQHQQQGGADPKMLMKLISMLGIGGV